MSAEEEAAYKAGVIAGKIEAIEDILASHNSRIQTIEKGQRIMEKAIWGFMGALILIQAMPTIKSVL